MEENILSWDYVKEEIKSAKHKNLLIGNGFSVDFNAKSFNQKSIIKEIEVLKDKDEIIDIERCIEETQNLVKKGTPYTVSKEIIDGWIKRELHAEFIEKLFNKMPPTVKAKKDYDVEQAKNYKDFLSLFDNYFSLNYDPLLYWLCLGFMSGDRDIQEYIEKTETSDDEEKINALNNCIKNIKKEKFSSYIDKENYTLRVLYKDICIVEKKLTEAEKESLIGKTYYNKTQDDMLEKIEEISNENNDFKKELESINEKISICFDEKLKENIELNEINNVKYNDGFLINKESKLLEWEPNREQNAFFLHGGFHILKKDDKVIKISAGETTTMLKNIKIEWEKGYDSLTVLECEGKNKLKEIQNNNYLDYCYQCLSNANGILVTHGVSFANSDDHITEVIHDNKNLDKIYLGLFKNADGKYPDLENYKNKFKNITHKICYYETNTIMNEIDADKNILIYSL